MSDTLVPDDISSYGKSIILDLVENIKNIKVSSNQLKDTLEKLFLLNPAYNCLQLQDAVL